MLVHGGDRQRLCLWLAGISGQSAISRRSSRSLTSGGISEKKPANQVRSIARAFVSAVEDKAWYYDKEFWRNYLSRLAGSIASTDSILILVLAIIFRAA